MNSQEHINILIIEDNLGDFLLIKDYLEEEIQIPGIHHAKRFSEAKKLLEDSSLHFDVILLDLTLPDKTGEALITETIELCPNTPVIVLTGYANLDFSVKSLSLKASDYLLKDDINAASLYKSIQFNIERKKTTLLLEESEKRYSNLFQLSPQPMWIFDLENYHFLQVNKAAIDQYQYSESEFLNMSLFDLVVDDFSAAEKITMAAKVSQSEEVYKGRFRHRKKTGDIIDVDIYSSLIRINELQYESVISIDVTDKIQREHKITKAIIKTQEDERFEIGTELHDNVCQILASSQLSLEMLKDKLPPESVQWLDKSKKFINLALEEIRNISHRLAPSFFDESTIEDTFMELLNNNNPKNEYEFDLDMDFVKMKELLNADIQLNLYRIMQEQLRNINKYAGASKISVKINFHENRLQFEITDNGIGFDIQLVKRGIGLANIKRRAELFAGTMEVNSAPGNGCRLVIDIPMQSAAVHA